LCSLALQACVLQTAELADLPVRRLPLATGQQVFLDMPSGIFDVHTGEAGVVEVSGQVPRDAASLAATTAADGIHLVLTVGSRTFWQGNAPLADLHLALPDGSTIHVTTYDAIGELRNFRGTAEVAAVAGRLTLDGSSGAFLVRSNRGDVTVESTSGQVHIAGNYGAITLSEVQGDLQASTIMGSIHLEGAVAPGDRVSLETDHGPIQIQLAADTDAAIQVTTTTGVITCTVPGLRYAGQGCSGTLGSGQGLLHVRTVSGPVSMEPLP
jgi:hypothetical protein